MKHYSLEPTAGLTWKSLPILRKYMGLPLTWNGLFFWWSQRYFWQVRPDWVALSVLKQGAFHLKRRVPGVKYVYEVHELAWYPGRDLGDNKISTRLDIERQIFSLADLVTVTTDSLKDILLGRPYSVATPIKVIPLAVDFAPLPPAPAMDWGLEIMYVGQMYQGQGVELLLEALTRTRDIRLTLIGGAPVDVRRLQGLSRTLNIEDRVRFTGFIAPTELAGTAANAHVFVAPFSAGGRMPYVAHTKLLEYAAWQRPVIAPDLPVTREHFTASEGWIPFVADDAGSLAEAMQALTSSDELARRTSCCLKHRTTTWRERSHIYIKSLNSGMDVPR
jgi:glycosyltransferase involved in cell wall biosynthesis